MKYLILILSLFLISITILSAAPKNNNIDQLMKQADSSLTIGNYAKAVDILLQAQKIEPNNQFVLYNLSLCYANTGEMDLAIESINKYLKKNKKNSEAYNVKGIICENIYEIDSAIFFYNKAISLEKDFVGAYYNRGRAYFLQRQYANALQDLLKAKKTMAQDSYFNNLLGQVYYNIGDYDKAITALEIAEKKEKKSLQIYQYLANAYYYKKEYQKSIDNYSQVLAIDSMEYNALNNRALAYTQLQMSDEAQADYARMDSVKKAQSVNPESLNFKRLTSEDNYLSFEVPEDWRAFVKEGKDTTVIAFFDPKYAHEIIDSALAYVFGGELTVIKNVALENPDTNNIVRRDDLEKHYLADMAKRISKYASYKIFSKKILNPTSLFKQGYSSVNYQITMDDEPRYGIDYYIVTTSGNVLELRLWVPVNEGMIYSSVLEYILTSLKLNEVEINKN